MVVLGPHDAPLPGRYWGEGQGPVASPSQASLLLARLNERARKRKAGVGKGTPRDGQGKSEVGQGGMGVDLGTPEHRLTADQDKPTGENKEEGTAATSKGQHHYTPPPLIQPSGDAKPKVNGVKMEESWLGKVESVRKKKKRRKGEEEEEGTDGSEVPEIFTSEQEGLVSMQEEGGEGSFMKKKKKRKRGEEESLKEKEVEGAVACQREGLVSSQEDGREASVTKKKKKKRKRKEEESLKEEEVEVVACQREGLVSLQDDGNEAPGTKKKKKKRKKEEEESLKEEEAEALKPMTSVAVDGTEESGLIKKKKKKKKHEEYMSEEEHHAGVDGGHSVKKEKKYGHENDEMEASGRRQESFSERPVNQRKKKRKRGEEGVEKMLKIETEDAETEQIHYIQQESSDTLSSPTKKKSKKDVKLEPKEDERQHDTSSSFKVPKTKIKEEVVNTAEDFEMEQKEEGLGVSSHIGGGNKEAKGEDGQGAKMQKSKKRERKKTMKKGEKGKNKEIEGFTLLTEVEATRRQKVQRTLPHWLANPTVIGRDLMADGTPVDSLPGLDSSLKDILKQQNIQQLFPVQRAVIPEILAGAGTLACRFRPRDVCVSAPTGSGKTLAYVLPLVQSLRSRTVPRIRALVLLPVQELATQVFRVFQTYCRGTPLRVGKAVGHSTLQKEQAALVAHHLDCHHSLIDILVATPGRLADHLRMTQGLDLSSLRYLVLDEADRMLAAEGGDWVAHVQRAIVDHQTLWESQSLPQPPLQRLLFSATLSSDPEQLQHVTLYHPKLFTVAAPAAGQDKSVAVVIGQYVRPVELREEYVVVEEEVKPLALHHLLVSGEGRHRVLIFTNSVQATHKLALLLAALSQGSSRVVAEFSSKRDKRQQILSQFGSGKIDVLVSSDAMARGLDIPNIDHVVSYDVTATTTYVHRIGRTARAGQPGTALSLVTKSTMSEFRRALSGGGEGACQLSLTSEELEPYEQQYIDALASLKATLEEEEREKRQNHSNEKAKKKKKQKKRQRKQKNDLRTARLAQKKANENKGKVSIVANRLHRSIKRP